MSATGQGAKESEREGENENEWQMNVHIICTHHIILATSLKHMSVSYFYTYYSFYLSICTSATTYSYSHSYYCAREGVCERLRLVCSEQREPRTTRKKRSVCLCSFLNKTLPLSVFILHIAVNSMCVSPSLSFSSIFSPPNLSLSLSASWLFCFLVRCNFPYITDLLWLMLIDNFFL